MQEISLNIVKWYQQNKTDLPWRIDKNPYHVWISEIMLQQTKIETVKKYYTKFIEQLPTIQSLAEVEEAKLLKLWEGLGYYNRARNLKATAQIIMEQYHGIFPTDYNTILTLKGIGEYTAGAISSICFQKPQVAVDGNVLRVYMRIKNCADNVLEEKTKQKVKKELLAIVPENSGDFNEGFMELGEKICLPKQPLCHQCPLQKYCKSYQANNQSNIPVRIKKLTKPQLQLTVFLLIRNKKIALSYRDKQSLLKNLWEFPNVEQNLNLTKRKDWLLAHQLEGKEITTMTNKHVFTHKIWLMTGYVIEVTEENQEFDWVSIAKAKKDYAIPTAFQPFLTFLEGVNHE